MRKAGGLVTRAEIEEELYGFEDDIGSNAIEVHIHNLRRKLGPNFITNIKGRGYRVENDARAERPWSLRRRMAIAVAGAACVVFVILGLLAYRALARDGGQFDEMLQQQATLALRYADHEYGEGESVVPRLCRRWQADTIRRCLSDRHAFGPIIVPISGLTTGPLATGRGATPTRARRALVARILADLRHDPARGTLGRADGVSRCGPVPHAARGGSAAAIRAGTADSVDRCRDGTSFRPVRRIATDLAGRGAEDLSAVNTAEMPVETHASVLRSMACWPGTRKFWLASDASPPMRPMSAHAARRVACTGAGRRARGHASRNAPRAR